MKNFLLKNSYLSSVLTFISMAAIILTPFGILTAQVDGESPAMECILRGTEWRWDSNAYDCVRVNAGGGELTPEETERVVNCQAQGGIWNDETGACDADEEEASWRADIGSGVESATARCDGAGSAVSGTLSSLSNSLGLGSRVSGSISGALSIGGGNNRLQSRINARVDANINSIAGRAGASVDSVVNSAVGSAGRVAGEAVSGVTGGIAEVVGGVQGTIHSAEEAARGGLRGIEQNLRGGVDRQINSAVDSAFRDPGSVASSLSGLDGAGAVTGVLGGGDPIPTDPTTTKDNIAAMRKKQLCEDAVTYAVAHNLVLPQALARATNYLNTGNNGMPQYALNMGQQYANVADNQTQILLNQINRSNSPIAKQVVPDVIRSEQANRNSDAAFLSSITPDIDKTTGSAKKTEDFLAGDPGACPDYLNCLNEINKPNNNPIDTIKAVEKQKAKKQEEAKQNLRELSSEGVLPTFKCVKTEIDVWSGEEYCAYAVVKTPAAANRAVLQQVATAPVNSIANVNAAAQSPAPAVANSLAEELYAEGFSGLSEGGGVATRVGDSVNGAMGQAVTDIFNSVDNNGNYMVLLVRAVGYSDKIINDLESTAACYENVAIGSAITGTEPQTMPVPVSQEVARLENYKFYSAEYRRLLDAINKNPLMRIPVEMVDDLTLQVQTLIETQQKTGGYLSSCQVIPVPTSGSGSLITPITTP